MAHPWLGPPWERSKTCLGLSSHWNFCIILAPWLPPLLGLMNTSRGLDEAHGIGLMANARCASFSPQPCNGHRPC